MFKFLEWIFPSNIYCISCNDFISPTIPYSLCNSCTKKINWIEDIACEKCGKKLTKPGTCSNCQETTRYFDKGFACTVYSTMEKEIIKNLKYKDKGYIGEKLSEIMTERLAIENINIDYIIPVPMFLKKQKKRGFNQAELLARGIGKKLNIEVLTGVIKRDINTKPMNSLTQEQRKENIKNAFTIDGNRYRMLEGRTILIVDDIFTTGSTIDECSRFLKEKGVDKVYALVFASGADDNTKIT